MNHIIVGAIHYTPLSSPKREQLILCHSVFQLSWCSPVLQYKYTLPTCFLQSGFWRLGSHAARQHTHKQQPKSTQTTQKAQAWWITGIRGQGCIHSPLFLCLVSVLHPCLLIYINLSLCAVERLTGHNRTLDSLCNKSLFIIWCWEGLWLYQPSLSLLPRAMMSSDTMRECDPLTL